MSMSKKHRRRERKKKRYPLFPRGLGTQQNLRVTETRVARIRGWIWGRGFRAVSQVTEAGDRWHGDDDPPAPPKVFIYSRAWPPGSGDPSIRVMLRMPFIITRP